MAYLFKQYFDPEMKDKEDYESYRKIRERQQSLLNTLTEVVNVSAAETPVKNDNIENADPGFTEVDNLVTGIFDNIEEPAVTYDVNKPLTTEENNMASEEKPVEMPIVEATPIMPVPTADAPQNIDEISNLTDKLNDTLKLETEEKTRAEETRIKYNLAEEELRKVNKEFDELKENIERNIEASNERIRQYREVSNEMDKKTMDTLNETAKKKELLAKMRLINNGDNQNTMTEDYQKRMVA